MFKRWQDWIMVLLGCWLIVSPSVLAYVTNHTMAGNAYVAGVALVAFNLFSAARLVDSGQEIVNILMGWWLVASPYALGFHGSGYPEYSFSAVGVAVIVLAFWEICNPAEARAGRDDS